MLENYEIKALEHVLYNPNFDDSAHKDYQKKGYEVWSDHAVKEGCFSDTETALHYKAKPCAQKMRNEYESTNGIIASDKTSSLDDAETAKKEKDKNLQNYKDVKHTELKSQHNAIQELTRQIKESIFLKKVSIAASNNTETDRLSGVITQLEQEKSTKITERESFLEAFQTHDNEENTAINLLAEQIETFKKDITKEKVNKIYAEPAYKNRSQREADACLASGLPC